MTVTTEATEIRQGSVAPALICTFYSFKGGVGRSMALANVAAMLAKWGGRVLVIDWDLEAPGLEKYFNRRGVSLHRRQSDGIVDLVTAFSQNSPSDWRAGLLRAPIPQGRDVDILHAGRDTEGYPDKLRAINWTELFERGLGSAIERIRDEARVEYDFVLIDSRTGITDIGGICTILLPDIVISLFTTNEQSLFGAADTMRRAQAVHTALPLERTRLVVVPVPARDESLTEYVKAKEWRLRFADRMRPFYEQWIPQRETAERVLDYLKIPHVPFWSFGEPLPVLEEATDNPKNLAFSYTLLARLIHSRCNWSEVEGGRAGAEAEARQQEESERRKREAEEIRLRAQEAEQKRAEQRLVELKAVVTVRYEVLASRERKKAERHNLSYLSAGLVFALSLMGAVAVWTFANTLTRPPIVPIIALLIVAFISGTYGFSGLLVGKDRVRAILVALEREHVAWEVGRDPYDKLTQEGALRYFAERIETIAQGAAVPTSPVPPPPLRLPAAEAVAAPPLSPDSPAPSDQLPATTGPNDVVLLYQATPITGDWVREFKPLLTAWLTELLGRDCKIQELIVEQMSEGTTLNDRSEWKEAVYLSSARVVVVVLTRRLLQSPFGQRELEKVLYNFGGYLAPISLEKGPIENDVLRKYQISDFSDLAYIGEGFSKSERSLDFQDRIRKLAGDIASYLDAPPADTIRG